MRGVARVLVPGLLIAATACGLPRDPEGTLDRVTGATLHAGAVDSPPWLVREGERATGPEAELVERFARSLGARVDWQWAALDDHLHALERFELDLVAGGLTAGTPWKRRVGLSRPWSGEGRRGRALAVPPGENGLLTALDRFIEADREPGAP